jgi:hypothetical protein
LDVIYAGVLASWGVLLGDEKGRRCGGLGAVRGCGRLRKKKAWGRRFRVRAKELPPLDLTLNLTYFINDH